MVEPQPPVLARPSGAVELSRPPMAGGVADGDADARAAVDRRPAGAAVETPGGSAAGLAGGGAPRLAPAASVALVVACDVCGLVSPAPGPSVCPACGSGHG